MSDLIDQLKKTMTELRELSVPPRHIHTIHDAIHALAASDRAYMDGYSKGDLERMWLATANSDLRSDILAVKNTLDSVSALHHPWPNRRECVECCLPWPCTTHRIMYPETSTTCSPQEANDE